MPLPQVNDRLKEIPAQALRTVFATIGQVLMAADRLRARAAEQLSGSGGATATPPAQQAPAEAPQVKPAAPRPAPAQDAETTRWRSLDKTGNVRLLDGDEEQDEEDLAVPATPAGYTPTEPVPAVNAQAGPVSPGPALDETVATSPAVPDPAGLAPTVPEPSDVAQVPDPAGLAPAVPEPADVAPVPDPATLTPAVPVPAAVAEPPAPAGEALPVPNYDQLSVASLRARLRVLDATQVQVLLDYEKAHEGRPAVITMFERRLTKLSEGS
jgi:hypothetical protein